MIILTLLFALLFNDPGLDSKWKEVDNLLQSGKPTSALKIVEEIYEIAKKDNVKPDLFRAILYKQKISFQIEEMEFAELIQRTEGQLAEQLDEEIQALLQSTLSSMYLQYLRRNYYRLQDRAYQDVLSEDVNQWSIRDLEERADTLMIQSVDAKVGDKTDLSSYKSLFNQEIKENTLYEFLLMQAIRHFQDDLSYMTEIQDRSKITAEQAYLDTGEFVREMAGIPTALNQRKNLVFYHFGKLIDYLLDQNAGINAAKVNILRLQYANSKFNTNDQQVESDYIKALEKEYKLQLDAELKGIYGVYLAKAYSSIASQYRQDFDKQYIGYYTKGMQILNNLNPKTNEIKQSILAEKNSILQKELNLQFEEVISPVSRQLIKLDVRNMSELYFRIVKLTTQEYIDYSRRSRDEGVYKSLARNTVVSEWKEEMDCNVEDFQYHSAEVFIPMLKYGQYVLLVSENKGFESRSNIVCKAAFFQVSDLDMMTWLKDKEMISQVVSRYEGTPINDCQIELFDVPNYRQPANGKSTFESRTNGSGQSMLSFQRNSGKYALLTYGDDKLYIQNIYSYNQYRNSKSDQAFIFLDRSIYRPGQRIEGKVLAIAYQEDNMPAIKSNEPINVILYDANGQVVEEKKATTNAFGSAQFAFNIPTDGLKGNYSINVGMSQGNGYKSVKVEEYRRPKFELTFNDNAESKVVGDLIEVSGNVNSYSGFPSQGSEVTYVVKESPYYQWYRCSWDRMWYPPARQSQIVLTGTTETDSKGQFTLDFQSDFGQEQTRKLGVQYTVEVSIVDSSGEQISESKQIYLTKAPFRLQHTIPSIITEDMDLSNVVIEGKNFEDQTIAVTNVIRISKFKESNQYRKQRNYQTDCQLYDESEFSGMSELYQSQTEANSEALDKRAKLIVTTLDKLENTLAGLDAGKYQFEIEAIDANNYSVIEQYNMLIAGDEMKSPTELGYALATQANTRVGESYIPYVLLHSEVSQVFVQKIRGFDIKEEGWFTRDEWMKKQFQITEADQGGFTINVFAWKKTDLYRESIQVEVPFEDTYLDISLDIPETIEPTNGYGLGVETTIENKPIGNVSITSVMYDASLDAIYPHTWKEQFYPTFYSNLNVSNHARELAQTWHYGNWGRPTNFNINLNYLPHTQWYGIVNPQYGWSTGNGRRMQKSMPMTSRAPEAAMDMMSADEESVEMRGGYKEAGFGNSGETPKPPKVRSNFSETMFFIANSETSKDGQATIDFTANDALTKWKILVFAHDKSMRYGFAEKTIVSKKNVQLIQNPTRTLTEGDLIHWPVTIQNNSGQNISNGKVTIAIQSLINGRDVTSDFVSDAMIGGISVASMEAKTMFFELNVPSNFKDAISVITSVTSSAGDDAEAQVIPVLSSQKYLTEGHSIWASPRSTETLAIEEIANSESANIDNVYIELTSNPFWLVARSFPSLSENSRRVTTSLVDNLFIESIAQDILDKNPEIEQVYTNQIIQNEGSQLDRNENLKMQTLNNTPWVRQAAAQRNQVADFSKYFNQSESAHRLQSVQQELRQRQNANGGLPWIDGGRSNVYTTLYTLLSMAKLHELGLFQLDETFVNNALNYTNKELERIWKQYKKDDQISTMFVDHLYLLSLLPEQYKSPSFTSNTYSRLQKYWLSQSLSYQAIAGIIFFNKNDDKMADAVKSSLIERMVKRDDGTIFWRGINEYYSYNNDFATQSLILQFLDKCSIEPSLLDQGTQWLIANKRSTEWYNDKGTSEVVYFLFGKYGANTVNQDDITLSINGSLVKLDSGLTFSTAQIDKSVGKSEVIIALENKTSLPIFGGFYRQYFQEANQITAHGQDQINIKKSVSKQTMTADAIHYKDISQDKVSVGDKLRVRLTIEVFDRMSYIYISDRRPTGSEPTEALSKYIYNNGMYGYESPSDVGMEYFLEVLPKGTHTLEYDVVVTQSGNYSGGLAEIQSFYVPEFSAFDGYQQLSVSSSEKTKD